MHPVIERRGMNVAVDLTNCDREPIHLLGSIQPIFLGSRTNGL